MTVLICASLILLTGYLAFRIGIRVGEGRQERARDELEEQGRQRGIRGTVRLSSVKIRR